ncbi:MAG: hypothetical protein ACOC5K_04220, partial [Chloroflexota bacterium]
GHPMKVSASGHTYEWFGDWAKIPDTESRRAGWAHHGMAVTDDQAVIAFHPGEPRFLIFDREGNLLESWDTGLTDAHGMSLVKEGEREFLWVADPGAKRLPELSYEYAPGPRKGRLVKMDMSGGVVQELVKPHMEAYREGMFSPTSVTAFQRQHGGNGDVWAADGYGQSYVHRYSHSGEHLAVLKGEEGAGRFNCPHSVFVDTRKPDPELYLADRANSRIQVYDLEGRFKRAFGQDFLTTPSAFTVAGEMLVVAELRARLTLLDPEDRLIGYLGENEEVCNLPGWPNSRDEDGPPTPSRNLEPGKFNSPHGVAADADGNLYVGEWLIGGRYTKLVRL